MSDLRARTLTAAIGAPILLAVCWIGGPLLTLLLALLSGLAFLELQRLFEQKGVSSSTQYVWPFVLLLPLGAGFWPGDFLTWFGALTLAWIPVLLLRELFSPRPEVLAAIGASFLAGLLGALPFASLRALHAQVESAGGEAGRLLVLVLFATWAADTCAYFGGRWLGRHKLFERVSPRKTVEGFAAGLLGALLIGAAVAQLLGLALRDGLLAGAVLGLIGPLGDLLESRLKRDAGVKDSARLLPGHGGVLDRFDAWILALPLLYLLARAGWLG
jgi:phosphatidate cytidylyltransferase